MSCQEQLTDDYGTDDYETDDYETDDYESEEWRSVNKGFISDGSEDDPDCCDDACVVDTIQDACAFLTKEHLAACAATTWLSPLRIEGGILESLHALVRDTQHDGNDRGRPVSMTEGCLREIRLNTANHIYWTVNQFLFENRGRMRKHGIIVELRRDTDITTLKRCLRSLLDCGLLTQE